MSALRNSADFETDHRLRVVTLLFIYLFSFIYYNIRHLIIDKTKHKSIGQMVISKGPESKTLYIKKADRLENNFKEYKNV